MRRSVTERGPTFSLLTTTPYVPVVCDTRISVIHLAPRDGI